MLAEIDAKRDQIEAGVDEARALYEELDRRFEEAQAAGENILPGDLLFFYSPISRVAMYVGGGRMIHASHPACRSAWSRCPGTASSAPPARAEPPRRRLLQLPRTRAIPSVAMAGAVVASEQDLRLVERLRAGDEDAFMVLVERLQPAMLRIARMYVATAAVAEEVVQDAWLGVLKGIDAFEGRSSLRTWIFRILVNIAKTRGARESRSAPFSSIWAPGDEDDPTVEPDRFLPADHDRWPGHWSVSPASWDTVPEEHLLSRETLAHVSAVIDSLPPNQREVIRLRDVLGWSSEEVRNALELSETNQRVLLHRARAKVRRALESYLAEEGTST